MLLFQFTLILLFLVCVCIHAQNETNNTLTRRYSKQHKQKSEHVKNDDDSADDDDDNVIDDKPKDCSEIRKNQKDRNIRSKSGVYRIWLDKGIYFPIFNSFLIILYRNTSQSLLRYENDGWWMDSHSTTRSL